MPLQREATSSCEKEGMIPWARAVMMATTKIPHEAASVWRGHSGPAFRIFQVSIARKRAGIVVFPDRVRTSSANQCALSALSRP